MNIRKATIKDKEIILELVYKLAQEEKVKPEEVQLSLDKIAEHAFGSNPYFYVLIAEYENKPVGYALYFFTYLAAMGSPILYLEDLFVDPQYRNKGIGTDLLSNLKEIASAKKCCRLEWHTFNWNKKAIQFYESIGAKPSPESLQFRLTPK